MIASLFVLWWQILVFTCLCFLVGTVAVLTRMAGFNQGNSLAGVVHPELASSGAQVRLVGVVGLFGGVENCTHV